MSDDSSNAIDALGIDTEKQGEDEPKKEVVTARNTWTVGLVDSDSESIIHDTDEEGGDEEDEDSGENSDEGNEYIDDEAEVVENYNSGDSMDSDQRREMAGMFLKVLNEFTVVNIPKLCTIMIF